MAASSAWAIDAGSPFTDPTNARSKAKRSGARFGDFRHVYVQARNAPLPPPARPRGQSADPPSVRVCRNPQNLGALPPGERLHPPPRPERRSTFHLVHQPVADADLARQLLNVRLGGEKAVGAAFHDEAFTPLSDDHPAGLPSPVEDDHFDTRLIHFPGRGQARPPRAHAGDRHGHPRAAAVLRAISASALTSSASSFKEVVRSSWTPSRPASSRYITSTSYNTSTWSHTNPMGTMRNAR